jgi:hypothetical protein
MKDPIMKYALWCSQIRKRFVFVPAAMLFCVLSAQAQTDATLPPVGGGGGGQFVARCPQGQFLTGFELRTGDDVDAIRVICVTAFGPADVGPPILGGISFGGTGGGNPQPLVCPPNAPIVTGMYVWAWGETTVTVSHIGLFCGQAATTQTTSEFPTVSFSGAVTKFTSKPVQKVSDTQRCPTSLVAVGINGRYGIWLDAVGLICGVPTLTPKPEPPPSPGIKAIGRAKGPLTNDPRRPICDVAREARARNNPAASGLEEQCRAELAAKGAAIADVDPIVAAGRAAEADTLYRQGYDIATGIFGDPALGANGNTSTGPGSLGIRDSLTPAGQRGFNASVKLHLSRTYAGTPGPATITASPNPLIVPNGQTSGTTTISWKVPQGYTYCEIYLSVDNGPWSEFARGGDGSKPTTIRLGSSHTFRMMVYEGQQGTPKVITTLTVTPKN